jgi:hypothetical protein
MIADCGLPNAEYGLRRMHSRFEEVAGADEMVI